MTICPLCDLRDRDVRPDPRFRLPDRRPAVRESISYTDSQGNTRRAEASFGIDLAGRIREVFCLAHKDGTEIQGIVHDACIALSMALQRGAWIGELAASFGELRAEGEARGEPASVIGALARRGAELEAELREGVEP